VHETSVLIKGKYPEPFESGQHSGGHETVSKEMGRPPGKWIEAAYRGWPSSTNLGDGRIGEDREQDGRTRNTLSFKGTGPKT
jgi:hypothetical protein